MTEGDTFEQLSSPRRLEDDRYEIAVPDRWQQGRGAFGGLVLATLVRAMERTLADPSRPLRALSATIAAPVLAQRAIIETRTLRSGSGLSALTATLSQEGSVCAHAIGTFAKDRAVEFVGWNSIDPPALGDYRDHAVVPVAPPLGPVFAEQFEFRPVEGIPMSGDAPRASGWVRAKSAGAARDAAYLTALVDTWWPCLMVASSVPRSSATITFTLEIVGDFDGLDPEAPFFYRARSPVCVGGYALETRELFGHDGRLLAVNHQTFAVLK